MENKVPNIICENKFFLTSLTVVVSATLAENLIQWSWNFALSLWALLTILNLSIDWDVVKDDS